MTTKISDTEKGSAKVSYSKNGRIFNGERRSQNFKFDRQARASRDFFEQLQLIVVFQNKDSSIDISPIC